MAYITTEQVKEIRTKIKKQFPTTKGWKFSIKRPKNYSGIEINILSAPVNFLSGYSNGSLLSINKDSHPYLQQIYSIANAGNYDNSNAIEDYFDVGWYVWLTVGSWDKEFEFIKA